METPVVFFAGMDQNTVVMLMRACKAAAREAAAQGAEIDPGAIAFSMATDTNMGWTVRELVAEVAEEHRMMTSAQAARTGAQSNRADPPAGAATTAPHAAPDSQ